jgi:hypothetical protein
MNCTDNPRTTYEVYAIDYQRGTLLAVGNSSTECEMHVDKELKVHVEMRDKLRGSSLLARLPSTTIRWKKEKHSPTASAHVSCLSRNRPDVSASRTILDVI